MGKREEGKVVAEGVRYVVGNGTEYVEVTAKKEVILSAGSIGSPHILELSGIGNTDILEQYGIEAVVANENVGENLQDHVYLPIGFEVIPGIPTLDNFTDPAYFEAALQQYISNATGPLATTGASSALLSCAQINCSLTPPSPSSFPWKTNPGLATQYSLLASSFPTEALTQELTVTGGMTPLFSNDSSKVFSTSLPGNFLTLLGVLEHPWSRGSIHITSANASVYSEIDPKYLFHPFDLALLSRIALHLQSIARSSPLSQFLKGNGTVYQEGYEELNEENVEGVIRSYLQSEYHPVGTCAMALREKGGVVDERFRVYGVGGLRVVDASVFPLLVRGNLQTLVYTVAERGVEFILEDGEW